MPFQFDPYADRFSGSIAQLLARRGDIGAQREMAIGNARAGGALASGNAWANAITGVGQSLAALPGQMQQQKRQALTDQLMAGRVADEQRMRAGESQVDTMMQQGQPLPNGAQGPVQESYLDADGLFDIPKMTAALGKSGFGSKAPDLLKGAEAINESILRHQDLEQKQAQAQAVVIGDMAAGVVKLRAIGMPTDAAMDFVAQPVLATKRIKPEEYAQVKAKILSLPPDQQDAALTSFMDQAAQISPTEANAEGTTRTDRYGRTKTTGGKKPPTTASLAAAAAAGDPEAAKAIALLHPDKPDTEAQDNQKWEAIGVKMRLKQPVTPEERAFFDTFAQRKTLGVDKSAGYAADRAARAVEESNKRLDRTQNFAEAQAGRKEISDKVEAPYLKAVQKVETLKDIVDAAQHGNMSAAAVQNLMGVLGVVTVEGVQRINTTELKAFGAQGNLLERIQGKIGQFVAGKPLAASVQADLKELADVLGKGSRNLYETQAKQIKKRYGPGMAGERLLPPPGAPPEGTARTINGVPAVWAYDEANDKWGWKKQ